MHPIGRPGDGGVRDRAHSLGTLRPLPVVDGWPGEMIRMCRWCGAARPSSAAKSALRSRLTGLPGRQRVRLAEWLDVPFENQTARFLYHGIVQRSVSPRKFNLICILAIVVVGATAMLMVEMSPSQGEFELPANTVSEDGTSSPFVLQPLELGLALAVVADMGLMTLGLVILFKDATPGRYRAR
jgi:hypothetical protein